MSFRRLIEVLTVLKLVSMPPSQRWSTWARQRAALPGHDFARLTLGADEQDGAAVGRQLAHVLHASWYIARVFSRLTMWILLR
jgi:hypothetical protein